MICREPNAPFRRRSFYDANEIQNYEPAPQPYALFGRRKSGKSLFNLAAAHLEFDEEEKGIHQVPGLSRRSSVKTMESQESQNEDFLKSVKDAMAKYQISDEVNIHAGEYETN